MTCQGRFFTFHYDMRGNRVSVDQIIALISAFAGSGLGLGVLTKYLLDRRKQQLAERKQEAEQELAERERDERAANQIIERHTREILELRAAQQKEFEECKRDRELCHQQNAELREQVGVLRGSVAEVERRFLQVADNCSDRDCLLRQAKK